MQEETLLISVLYCSKYMLIIHNILLSSVEVEWLVVCWPWEVLEEEH